MKNIESFNIHYIEALLEGVGSGELKLMLTDELRDILSKIDHTIAKLLIDSEGDMEKGFKFTYIGIDSDKENFNKFVDEY